MNARAPSGESQRLFFALWPSDEFRVELETAAGSFALASGGSVIPPRNFHVTLLFLGDVLRSRIEAVQLAGAAAASAPAFELNFDRVESWGRNVLCLTPSVCPAAAMRLADQLREGIRDEPLRLSEHEFRPHITLARDLPRACPPEPIGTLCWEVRQFVLVESQRDSGGSHYSVIGQWALASVDPNT